MDIGVEISLYPLQADFGEVIHQFIERMSADGRFRVVSNSMSTQVFGSYDEVLDAVRRELLSELSHHQPNSRLSCQIEFTPDLAGLRVTIAPDE